MTKTKNTKRALLSSVLALFLCFAMLIGTTYAWFTDSVTSAGNIIKSGTLDVTMEWKDATANGAQQTYKDASEGAIFNYDKWEPGYVEAKNIKISNAGTLALKYQLAIVATGEVSKLTDAIDVYYAEGEYTLFDREMTELTRLGTLTEVLAKVSETANGELLKGETDTVTIALKMQETANNDYQGLSIGSEFAVKCFATQLTSETDSFDDQYDAMATIDTEAELLEALAADYDYIALGANIAITNSVEIPAAKTVTIDLMGYTMSQVNAQQTAAYAMISNKGDLTIEDSIGAGKISYTDTTPYTTDPGWASNTIRNEGTLTINGGTVENLTPEDVMSYGYPHAIDAYQGSVTTINGGTVKSLNYDSIRMFCNSDTLATKVVINGGTIVNRVSFQDPQSTRPGYGILEINGGNFVTMNGVTANVRLLNFCQNCSNMKATVTGGTFDKGFTTQDYAACGVVTSDWLDVGNGVVTPVATSTAADLADAAANGGNVVILKDISDAPAVSTAPYGNYYGIAQNGGVIDGNGNVLDFDMGEMKNGKYDNYGIMTSGGTIKNVTITGIFRGIMIMNPTEDLYIDNVVIGDEDVCYAINTGEGDGTYSLYVSNSTIKGWSSYGTAIKDVTFTNCTFAQGEYYTDVFGRLVKPYVDTVFDGCEFNSKFYIDLSRLGKDGDGNVLDPDAKIVLRNCTVNGVKLTAENYMNLIVAEDVCGDGQITIESPNGTYDVADWISYVVIE